MSSTTAPNDNDSTLFDVREIPCRVKHAQIFERWTNLAVGAHFVLVNDHDPVPLYYQFASQFPDAFTWEYLLREPDEIRVKITRTAATPTPGTAGAANGGCASVRAAGEPLDVRGLEPPEPMIRIIAALENVKPGEELRALTDRKPVPLLAELNRRGIAHASHEQRDGSWINTFRRV